MNEDRNHDECDILQKTTIKVITEFEPYSHHHTWKKKKKKRYDKRNFYNVEIGDEDDENLIQTQKRGTLEECFADIQCLEEMMPQIKEIYDEKFKEPLPKKPKKVKKQKQKAKTTPKKENSRR